MPRIQQPTLPQRILVALVPLHELGDAVVQAPVRLVATFRLEPRGVGVRLVNIAQRYRQEFLLRRLAKYPFNKKRRESNPHANKYDLRSDTHLKKREEMQYIFVSRHLTRIYAVSYIS